MYIPSVWCIVGQPIVRAFGQDVIFTMVMIPTAFVSFYVSSQIIVV